MRQNARVPWVLVLALASAFVLAACGDDDGAVPDMDAGSAGVDAGSADVDAAGMDAGLGVVDSGGPSGSDAMLEDAHFTRIDGSTPCGTTTCNSAQICVVRCAAAPECVNIRPTCTDVVTCSCLPAAACGTGGMCSYTTPEGAVCGCG